MKNCHILAFTMLILCVSSTTAFSQRHERKAAELAASSEVHAVQGGSQFILQAPGEKTFAAIVKLLNLSGRTVEKADKDTGLIATAMQITGGYKQTGTRLIFTVVNSSETETIVRIAATEQKRYKGLQTEPWSDPKIDAKVTAAAVTEFEQGLKAELSKK